MKISTKLTISVFVPVLVALVVGSTLIISYRGLETAQDNGDKVRLIRNSITEINHLVFSYVTYPEERPKQQLLAEYEKMIALLAGVHFRNPDQQQLLKEIRLNSQSIKDDFLRLVANIEHSGPAGSNKLRKETEELLEGQLLIRSRKTDSIASTLRSQVDNDIRNTQKREITLILLLLVLTTFPLTFVLVRTGRSIISSLNKLRQGTEVIGAGNLDFVIEEKKKDEIGELAKAFNRMTSSLKEVTASKADLEREMAERQKAETELRASQESLKKARDDLEIEVAERTEELTAEVEQRKRTEEALRESEEELRYLSSQILVAQEKERREIAEDLHDNTWQILNTIKIDIDQLLSPKMADDLAIARRMGKRIIANIRVATERIRTMQGDLWPPLLDDIGLLGTINWYGREFETNHAGITIEKQIGVSEEEVPQDIKIVIYRVMQEALKNAAQHGLASRVLLSLKKDGPGIEFAVIDNGEGFDLEQILFRARQWAGFGLMGMKERIEHSGGTFDVRSGEGIGTTIRAVWPLTGADQEIPDRRPIRTVFERQEEPFRMVTETISDWVYGFRIEPDGKVVWDWVTSGFTLVTGYRADVDLAAILHPEDKAVAEERFRHIQALHPHVSEYRIVTKSGDTCWVRDSVTPVADPLHPGTIRVVGAAQDITERKRTEAALHDSETRYRALFETMVEAFLIAEIISDAGKLCDLRCIEVNPAFERQSGLKAADVIGRTFLELFPKAGPIWLERYGKVAFTGEEAHFESSFGPLGKWFEVSAYRTEPNRFAVMFFDITERKQTELEIQRNVEDLRVMNEELTRFNSAAVDRELRMIELKKQINELCGRFGQQPRYPLDFGPGQESPAAPQEGRS
ncbi:MAG: PAS domain S-box protein [Thermodesulfobacteriota bacterium]